MLALCSNQAQRDSIWDASYYLLIDYGVMLNTAVKVIVGPYQTYRVLLIYGVRFAGIFILYWVVALQKLLVVTAAGLKLNNEKLLAKLASVRPNPVEPVTKSLSLQAASKFRLKFIGLLLLSSISIPSSLTLKIPVLGFLP
jgi:hypothetical protein